MMIVVGALLFALGLVEITAFGNAWLELGGLAGTNTVVGEGLGLD
jgi:hypothetical protein